MPSSKTITAFYTYAPREKIMSSKVNCNFDNFRGHFIPIHDATQTSSCDCFCLGTSDHRWKEVHTQDLYVGGSPIAASFVVGDIKGSYSASLPSGFLLCDGSTINKTTNPTFTALVDLLRSMNTTSALYAGSIAAEAFLPDMRGKFLRGNDPRPTGAAWDTSWNEFRATARTKGSCLSDTYCCHDHPIDSISGHCHCLHSSFTRTCTGAGVSTFIYAGGALITCSFTSVQTFTAWTYSMYGYTGNLPNEDMNCGAGHSHVISACGYSEVSPKNISINYYIKW